MLECMFLNRKIEFELKFLDRQEDNEFWIEQHLCDVFINAVHT
jgi:hypothetical protein